MSENILCKTFKRLVENLRLDGVLTQLLFACLDEDGTGGDDAYDAARYGIMVVPPGEARSEVLPALDPLADLEF